MVFSARASSSDVAAAHRLREALLLAHVAPEQRLHVDGQSNDARLVGERARDGLTDPPRGVRREARAAIGIELLHRVQEAEITLLDEIEERQAAVAIAARDLHHQP